MTRSTSAGRVGAPRSAVAGARPAETVRRLTDAALAELREVGYDRLTLRHVARRAGVAPATAYTYFSSKSHVVAEVYWRVVSEQPRPLLPGGRTAVERVTRVFDELAAVLAPEPELCAAAAVAVCAMDPAVGELRLLIGDNLHARLQEALGDAAGEGTAEILDALVLAWSGAMLQAGMGHAEILHVGARMAGIARRLLAGCAAAS